MTREWTPAMIGAGLGLVVSLLMLLLAQRGRHCPWPLGLGT